MNLRLLKVFSFVTLCLSPFYVRAEGTRTSSPTSTDISALKTAPDLVSGSYYNCPVDNRLYIHIENFNTEKIYYGFNWQLYSSGNSSNLYYQFVMPNGTRVGTPILYVAGTTPGPASYLQAFNGPNIGGVTTGYTPNVFTPTVNGDYWIEMWQGTSAANSTALTTTAARNIAPWWDITVAAGTTAANAVKKDGRIYSGKWGMVTIDPTSLSVTADASGAPKFFGYTSDSTVIALEFQPGFKPISFDVALNSYGITNTGDFASDRISRNDAIAPTLLNGFKVFLNSPDAAVYPISTAPIPPTLLNPAITGCAAPYKIRFNVAQAGDVKIELDLDATPGYQAGGADRILEGFDFPVGNGSLDWDGRDGKNVLVTSANIKIAVSFLRGRFNVPIYDAEINSGGIRVYSVAPNPTTNTRIYWNDATLTNVGTTCNTSGSNQSNNVTGAGLDNAITGTLTPAHAWNGNGNLTQTIPAPYVGTAAANNENNTAQCDDFGNVRTINSWGWVAGASSASSSGQAVGCISISGTVWRDADNSAAGTFSNIFTTGEIGTNAGGLFAVLIDPATGLVFESVAVSSNGTYTFTAAPKNAADMIIRLTSTAGTAGALPPAVATLPAAYTNTTPLSQTVSTVLGNVTGKDFGVELLPTVTSQALTAQGNPGGKNNITITGNFTFADADGFVSSLNITSFPNDVTSIRVGNVTYYQNAGSLPSNCPTASCLAFPATGGVTVPVTSGTPALVSIDPVDGAVTPVITYRAIDNAGKPGAATATISVPLTVISVSGNVWNDADNSKTNNGELFVSGNNTSVTGSVVAAGANLYINLINAAGNVIQTVPVGANGTYTLNNVPGATTGLKLQLSAVAGSVDAAAVTATLPSNWVPTGNSINNNTTTQTGTANIIDLNTGSASVTLQNFGIERLPTADAKAFSAPNAAFTMSTGNGFLINGQQSYSINANSTSLTGSAVKSLSGSDPEDCANASSCVAGKTYVINTIKSNTRLFYLFSGTVPTEVTANTTITNFNPANLTVYGQKGQGTGANSLGFTYSLIDNAGKSSPAVAYSITAANTPLPVELTDISANVAGNAIIVTWHTATEQNMSDYIVERSVNGQDFVTAGNKRPEGSGSSYSFTDAGLASGTYYYRLKMMEYSGTSVYSKIVTAKIESGNAAVVLSPNPAANEVKITGLQGICSVTITDLSGKLMTTAENVVNNQSLNISVLPAGMYMVRVADATHAVTTFRLIKQ